MIQHNKFPILKYPAIIGSRHQEPTSQSSNKEFHTKGKKKMKKEGHFIDVNQTQLSICINIIKTT